MTVSRRLAIGALGLGAAAPFAGDPARAANGRLDVAEAVEAIQGQDDHVDALELATWIRSRKAGLRVIDVRSPDEFARYAIPTAENLPLDRLVRTAFSPAETLVLYSEGGAHAGQAWVLLRALGVHNALFIAGGLVDWFAEVMNPVLPAEATAEQHAAFDRASELSRYFGGDPQSGVASPAPSASGAAPQLAPATFRRRGC